MDQNRFRMVIGLFNNLSSLISDKRRAIKVDLGIIDRFKPNSVGHNNGDQISCGVAPEWFAASVHGNQYLDDRGPTQLLKDKK